MTRPRKEVRVKIVGRVLGVGAARVEDATCWYAQVRAEKAREEALGKVQAQVTGVETAVEAAKAAEDQLAEILKEKEVLEVQRREEETRAAKLEKSLKEAQREIQRLEEQLGVSNAALEEVRHPRRVSWPADPLRRAYR